MQFDVWQREKYDEVVISELAMTRASRKEVGGRKILSNLALNSNNRSCFLASLAFVMLPRLGA
jgi:hypothetical protein